MLKKAKKYLPLIALTLIAFFLRIWDINLNPPALNWDEISHGYNAFSILKTGKDEWGVSFPLIFRAFGDYKLPVYIYLTTIPVALLGLNAISVRLVSVVAGSLAIPGIYLLVKAIFPKEQLTFKLLKKKLTIPYSYLAAFFLTFLPWHFFISRPALEANLSLTFTIYAAYFLIRALKQPNYYLHASILASLSLHTYNTSRVFIPLLLIIFYLVYRPKIKLSRKLILSAFIFLSSLAIVFTQIISGTGTARYQKLAILSEQAVFQIGESRQNSNLSPLLARLRYNRPVYFIDQFTQNFLNYFSPQFIYQSSGAQRQFAIPIKNLFTLNLTILAFLGLIFIIKNIRQKPYQFLLLFLLCSPVAAALTASPPQALRPNPMIVPVVIMAVLGFSFVVQIFRSRSWAKSTVALIMILSFLFSSTSYLNSYWHEYRFQNSEAWQYGYQQAIDYVSAHQSEYDRVFITKYHGEPHLFYAFFTRLDPKILQPEGDSLRFKQSDWFWTDRIRNVYFVNDWDIPFFTPAEKLPLESGDEISTQNALLIGSGNNLPSNTEVIKIIDDLSGNIAFVIAKFK